MKTKVLLADDHAIVRQGLRAILESQEDMEVIGEAETGFEALRMAKELAPHVVLMDLAMPKLNGLEAARLIRKETPATQVLILSSYSYEEYVEKIMEIGAAGYLVKQNAGVDLIKALREVRKGNAFFSPSISKRILERSREAFRNGEKTWKTRRLTARELEVLELIAQGDANKMIADKLAISIKTVEKHRQALMDKLNIHETASLTRYAFERGIIETANRAETANHAET